MKANVPQVPPTPVKLAPTMARAGGQAKAKAEPKKEKEDDETKAFYKQIDLAIEEGKVAKMTLMKGVADLKTAKMGQRILLVINTATGHRTEMAFMIRVDPEKEYAWYSHVDPWMLPIWHRDVGKYDRMAKELSVACALIDFSKSYFIDY